MANPSMTIVVECYDGNNFTVRVGDRYCDKLCWDEMLAQVVNLTHPNLHEMGWYTMRTKEEWDAYRAGPVSRDDAVLEETEQCQNWQFR